MEKVFLSLGTNLGNKVENLKQALKLLKEKGISVEKISGLYDSEPVGMKSQPDFNNIAVRASTDLAPEGLLALVKAIERDMGRIKEERYGPRIIDIDILSYGSRIIRSESLVVPHPEIPNRLFVLVPLAEIAPDYIHPLNGQSAAKMAEKCGASEKVTRLGDFA